MLNVEEILGEDDSQWRNYIQQTIPQLEQLTVESLVDTFKVVYQQDQEKLMAGGSISPANPSAYMLISAYLIVQASKNRSEHIAQVLMSMPAYVVYYSLRSLSYQSSALLLAEVRAQGDERANALLSALSHQKLWWIQNVIEQSEAINVTVETKKGLNKKPKAVSINNQVATA